jgi:hypothetical protein
VARILASGLGNPYAFTGQPVHQLKGDDLQLPDNRNRTDEPYRFARYNQPDPLGIIDETSRIEYSPARPAMVGRFDPKRQYTDAMNLYQYVRTAPTAFVGESSTLYPRGYGIPSATQQSDRLARSSLSRMGDFVRSETPGRPAGTLNRPRGGNFLRLVCCIEG